MKQLEVIRAAVRLYLVDSEAIDLLDRWLDAIESNPEQPKFDSGTCRVDPEGRVDIMIDEDAYGIDIWYTPLGSISLMYTGYDGEKTLYIRVENHTVKTEMSLTFLQDLEML